MDRAAWFMLGAGFLILGALMSGAAIAWLSNWLRRQLDEPDEHERGV